MSCSSSFTSVKYLVLAVFVTIIVSCGLLFTGSIGNLKDVPLVSQDQNGNELSKVGHPIHDLILEARAQYSAVLAKRSINLTAAGLQYRERRGRHPPPGFDQWFKYAQSQNAVMVEDFFDRIYDDLNPYWALDPKSLRYQANVFDFKISVRNGTATFKTDDRDRVPWIQLWHNLITKMSKHLPDFDIPVNMMDEPRLLVPWETVSKYMKVSDSRKILMPIADVVLTYTGLATFDAEESKAESVESYDPQWKSGSYWDIVTQACPPDSPAANATTPVNFDDPPLIPEGYPKHSHDGYVRNWTLAKDTCSQPHLRGLHGTFIEPLSIQTSQKLIPMFGGSKLSVNNEILLPAPAYLSEEVYLSGGRSHGPPWKSKTNGLMWRGVASGGRNRNNTWMHFQRHRFLQMMNGSAILKAEEKRSGLETSELPNSHLYNLKATYGYLGNWLASFADAAFIDLACFPSKGRNNKGDIMKDCDYTNPFFEVKEPIPMSKQYDFKYLPDIDGNSFSGRYRALFRSTSLPIKATIYNEWHDSRLFPWVHFVPMDNTFVDIYGILDYFMGYEGIGHHDAAAQRIAEEGKEWMEKVGRKVDMEIYVWRLVLEWARICDDQRERLGWVDDLKGGHIEKTSCSFWENMLISAGLIEGCAL